MPAANNISITGRLIEGQALTAETIGNIAAIQWQTLSNGSWINVGSSGASYVLPAGSSGKTYRAVSQTVNGLVASDPTLAVAKDTNKAHAPTLQESAASTAILEQAPAAAAFDPITFSDSDSTAYAGGTLTILNSNALSRGGDGLDTISVLTGTGQGKFSYNATTGALSYGLNQNGSHTVVGQVDLARAGAGTDFAVTFNNNATKAVVNALVHSIAIANSDDSPQYERLLTIQATDSTGRSAQVAHRVAVIGSNDLPFFTGPNAFMVNEGTTSVGTITARDPDLEPDVYQASFSLVAGQGDTDNALFTIEPFTGALRFLAVPDFEGSHSPSYSIRVQARDSNYEAVQQVVSVTVANVNEAPVAQALSASIGEDATAPIQLQASFTDPEGANGLALTFNASTTVGTVSLNGTTFTYTPSPSFNALVAGQTLVDQFAYTVTDPGGLSATQTARVTVVGANDVATIEGPTSASVTEDVNVGSGAFGNGNTVSVTGQLSVIDPDAGQSQFTAGRFFTGRGELTLSASGAWRYEIGNDMAQHLPGGVGSIDTVDVTSADGSARRTMTFTTYGVNDVPTIGGSSTASIDLATGPGTPLRASGALTIVDPDLYESSFAGVTAARGPANLGTFTVSEDGRWDWEVYALGDGIKAIPAGQVFEDRYTVTSRDGSASKDIVIQITGVNEPATFRTVQDRPLVEDQPDPDGKLRTSGRVVVVDPDTGESLVSGPTTQHYMLGTFNMDAQGFWTYEVDASHPMLQWVGGESFPITSLDGTQGRADVQLTMVPDAPIIVASGAGTVVEAGHLDDGTALAGTDVASGQMVATDADTYPSNTVWVRWSGSRAGTYGDFTIDARTGVWSYQLDNARPATQALAEGQQVTEAFDVTVRDDTYLTDTDQVVITILGTNDKPVIQASGTTGDVGEAAPQVPATGQLLASDPDGTFLVFGAQSVLGQFGTFNLDTAGAWNYLVDAGDPDTIALAQGQVGVDTFPVGVQDQFGAFGAAQVTVNVLGA